MATATPTRRAIGIVRVSQKKRRVELRDAEGRVPAAGYSQVRFTGAFRLATRACRSVGS